MTRISTFGMFSFEVHVKLLAGLAATVPLIILLTSFIIRVEFHRTGDIPIWVKSLNVDVLKENSKKDAVSHKNETEVYVWSAVSYIYLFLEILLAGLLWKATNQKSIGRLQVWILCCVCITGIGLLLLNSFRTYEIIEVGLVVVYTKLSLVYSVYTLIVVFLLIMKLKMAVTT